MLLELKRLVRNRAWVRGHAPFLLSQAFDRERNTRQGVTDDDPLRAAAQWSSAAQDSGLTAWHRDTGDDEAAHRR